MFEPVIAVCPTDATPRFMLGKLLALMPAFHAHVVMLYLVYLAVDGKPRFPTRDGQWDYS